MIDTSKLKGKLAENDISQAGMAKKIGITPKTFYEKMQKGIFDSDEIEIICKALNISEAKDIKNIFFASLGTD